MGSESYRREAFNWRRLSDGFLVPVDSGVAPWPGDPGDGNYYLGYAIGGNPKSQLSYGQAISQNKISVEHTYAASGWPSEATIDGIESRGHLPSMSVKLGMAGNVGPGSTAIINGSLDSQIRDSAQMCAEKGPMIMCVFHEPGGDFNTTALRNQYRQASRRFITLFKEEGADNVAFTCILEAPYEFRPTPFTGGSLGGSRSTGDPTFTWPQLHPDWKGTSTPGNPSADWWTGDNRLLDLFGLDIYNPVVGGTSFQPYDRIWRDVAYYWNLYGFPIETYGGCAIFEMGWSNVATPAPDHVAYANATLVEQVARNIKIFTYWNDNTATPPRYDMAEAGNASDPDGSKYDGWQIICDSAIEYEA